jgi:hypothetical protein
MAHGCSLMHSFLQYCWQHWSFHDFSCSLYHSGPVWDTLIATRIDTKAEPVTGRTLTESCDLQVLKNKVNSHMWHLQLSKIVVLSKENLSPLYKVLKQWPWGLSQGLWGHHSWLLNLEVPKPRQIPASSLLRCVGYPTMWPKTKP